MGKQIQIVGANNAPYVAKELDLESGNQFTFAKPNGTDVVEVGALDFIKAIEEYDTFKDWVVNYKRDENTIIPLRIDKIEGNVDTEKIVYTFTNDDVDVSSITLVKLIVEMVNATNEISASYVDETKEIEAGTVLPTPSADDNGKVLGIEDGAYALITAGGGGTKLYKHVITWGMGVYNTLTVIATDNTNYSGALYENGDFVILPLFSKAVSITFKKAMTSTYIAISPQGVYKPISSVLAFSVACYSETESDFVSHNALMFNSTDEITFTDTITEL